MTRSSSSGLVLFALLFTSVRSFNFFRISRNNGGAAVFGSQGRRTGEGGSRTRGKSGGGRGNIGGNQWWRRPPVDEEYNLISTRFRLETDELLPITITDMPSSSTSPLLQRPGDDSADMMMLSPLSLLSSRDSPSSIIDSSSSDSGFFHMTSDFGSFGETAVEDSRGSGVDAALSSSSSSEDLVINHVLPSLMEPGPAPPKPEFDRNNNFTLNVSRETCDFGLAFLLFL